MGLSPLFIPFMAYVKSIERQPNPDAQQVHDQLQVLIQGAREQALNNEVAHERFNDALFPVVAWSDERLANLAAWRETHDWRAFMLTRKLFATTVAGVKFFERLQALAPEDNDLREIFVLCLCMNFLGRFAQNPNDPALVQLRLDNYKLLRPQGVFVEGALDKKLFPEAYRVTSDVGQKRRQQSNGRRLWLLGVALPIAALVALGLVFHYDLSLKINDIKQMLNP